MNSKTRNLKSGNESGVIIAILAVLLVLVAVIVGAVVLKDNKAVATFDGGKVTKKEYQVYYEMFSSYLESYGYSASEIPNEILKKAVSDKMILADAKKAGVKLSKEDKAEVDEVFKDENYLDYFKQYYNFSIDALRQIYYNDYIISAYIEKVGAEASDEAISEYIKSKYKEDEEIDMNEYDTSHILFSFTDSSTNQTLNDEQKAELKKKAEGVLEQAKNGEDFAELAKEHSADSTASEGGKYKMYMDNYTVEEYSNAVKEMKVGEVYPELVETQYGYHIIKLNAVNENGRLKSENERGEYANQQFSNLAEDGTYEFDETLFKEFVLSLNPDAYTDKTTNTDGTTNTTTTVDGTGDNTITVGE